VLIDRDHPDISLKTQCELLSLNRTHLYYQPLPPSAEELAVKRRIDELYTDCPFYGSHKIAVVLGLNRKLVQRHTLAPALQVQVCAKWASPPSSRVPTPANRPPNTVFFRIFCDISRQVTPITSGASK